MRRRVVVDTNVYVSRLLNPLSVPGHAVAKALQDARTLVSFATWTELQTVLRRPKLAPYIQPGSVEPFLEEVLSVAIHVEILSPIRACRDPRDDKFLEVAVHGRADIIVTGDRDLLDLNPFRSIAILTPAEYLERG
ncbi:MAG TPA: putative toxin-antitoxin system toxin component, PIN family [Terracidiphilus sp.]|jgi:putative PIN family toxin of toxin-antitoxin system